MTTTTERRKKPRHRVTTYAGDAPQLYMTFTAKRAASEYAARMRDIYRKAGAIGIFVRMERI